MRILMEEVSPIKLSELTQKIEGILKQSFGSGFYWMIAEISSHKFYPNQDRHYFDFIEKAEGIKDPIAKVKGVSWFPGSQTIKLFESSTGQIFTNGLQVLVRVKVEFSSSFGLQLVLTDIDQSFTLGNIEKQRRETLKRLGTENPGFIQKMGEDYLTANKKLNLNSVLQQIALIGSPNSEGYADFIHTLQSNQYGYAFSIDSYQSSVQGSEAGKELINKLISIHTSGTKYDCVVIIRGGGAKSDFLVFDTYDLSRAAAKFPIPIITGIGHHKDVSVVDRMVHTSTKTPTKAAEFIISHCREFEESILTSQKSIIIRTQQLLNNARQEINATHILVINKSRILLNRFKDKLVGFNQVIINKTKTILYNRQTNLVSLLNQILSKPRMIIGNRNSELANLIGNFKIFSSKYLTNKKAYLTHYKSMINILSPKNILKRGFAMVSHQGKIINNAEAVNVGNNLIITLSDGDLHTKVISKTKTDGRQSEL